MYTTECVIIGGGVVGLAIAREAASLGLETILIERNSLLGDETSSRNSEVIHAGIYYPENSLKAKMCVAGKKLLYDYCEERKIEFSRCGKLVVANDKSGIEKLHHLINQGRKNGVNDLKLLSSANVSKMEPQIDVLGALYSPSTGIIDSHDLINNLHGDFVNLGGIVVPNTAVTKVKTKSGILTVDATDSNSTTELQTKYLINAAGLNAHNVAADIENFPRHLIPQITYVKGSYFTSSTGHNFKKLVYPLPQNSGLGIHLTIDLAGNIKFGPDTEIVSKIDYRVDENKRSFFYESIKRYWPKVEIDKLQPGYSGIRTQIINGSNTPSDFVIQDCTIHRGDGLINLFAIDSPGLTSSLALGKYVGKLLK